MYSLIRIGGFAIGIAACFVVPQVFFPSFFLIRNSELVKFNSSLMKFIKVNGTAFLFKAILFESLIVKVPEVFERRS